MGRLPQLASRQSSVELRRLSEELGRLRETSTQYDLTVERELKELRERVVFLEQKLRENQLRPNTSAPASACDSYRTTPHAQSDRNAAVISVH